METSCATAVHASTTRVTVLLASHTATTSRRCRIGVLRYAPEENAGTAGPSARRSELETPSCDSGRYCRTSISTPWQGPVSGRWPRSPCAGWRPVRLRHRDHQRGGGWSGAWRSRPGARSSPTHQHRHLRAQPRATSSEHEPVDFSEPCSRPPQRGLHPGSWAATGRCRHCRRLSRAHRDASTTGRRRPRFRVGEGIGSGRGDVEPRTRSPP